MYARCHFVGPFVHLYHHSLVIKTNLEHTCVGG